MTMTAKNTKSQNGDTVSELSSSDLFGDECSEIVIRLQMLAYPDDKKRFESFLMDKLKEMLEAENGEKIFEGHKLVSARYDVELRHVKLPSNAEDSHGVRNERS